MCIRDRVWSEAEGQGDAVDGVGFEEGVADRAEHAGHDGDGVGGGAIGGGGGEDWDRGVANGAVDLLDVDDISGAGVGVAPAGGEDLVVAGEAQGAGTGGKGVVRWLRIDGASAGVEVDRKADCASKYHHGRW